MIGKIREKIRRFRHFKNESYYTLNGWRFADLKRYIDKSSTVTEDSQFAFFTVNDEINRINSGQKSSFDTKIALVTCLPPDDTGIARYSLLHIINSHVEIDAFSVVRDPAHFMLNATKISARSKTRARLFPLSTLLSLNEINQYRKLIFVIGNSDHNIEVYRAMETFIKVNGSQNVYCYLHDPCCHNVAQMAKSLSHDQYIELLDKLYEDKIPSGLAGVEDSWRVHHQATEASIYGCRAIVDIGVHNFLVNSSSAKKILQEDIRENDISNINIKKLYHPVFALENGISPIEMQADIGDELVIGTFGMPGRSKMTDVIIEASRELVRRGRNIRLIIAGYHTDRYLHSYFGDTIPSWIDAASPESEYDLQLKMAQCHVAIQLRLRNLGESSGIVPTLLRMNKPVIVSNIGSFKDYGSSVLYFEGESKLLVELLDKFPMLDDQLISNYTESHTIERFSVDFVKSLDM